MASLNALYNLLKFFPFFKIPPLPKNILDAKYFNLKKLEEAKLKSYTNTAYRQVSSPAIDRTSSLSRRDARSVAHPAARQSISHLFPPCERGNVSSYTHSRYFHTQFSGRYGTTRYGMAHGPVYLFLVGITIRLRESTTSSHVERILLSLATPLPTMMTRRSVTCTCVVNAHTRRDPRHRSRYREIRTQDASPLNAVCPMRRPRMLSFSVSFLMTISALFLRAATQSLAYRCPCTHAPNRERDGSAVADVPKLVKIEMEYNSLIVICISQDNFQENIQRF